MVEVAKSIDLPVKLLLPINGKFSMLGLGDIVIPGILLSWLLKYEID
mgnify:CR=1 FL=1